MSENIKEQFNKALIQHKSGNLEDARLLYNEIIDQNPDNIELLLKIFNLFYQRAEFKYAEEYIKKVVEKEPLAKYYRALGDVYYNQKEYEKALKYYLPVVKACPDSDYVCFKIGTSYSFLHKADEAIEYLSRVVALNDKDANTHYNLALSFEYKLELEKAVEHTIKSIELKSKNPEALYLLSTLFLKMGNFAEGWELYETRFFGENCIAELKSSKPQWDGSSLENKTIYVQHEQGIGDCIMFSRFIYTLKEKGAKVLFKPHKLLYQLFKDNTLPCEIISPETSMDDLEFDTYMSLMSLPTVLKINESNIPLKTKYLNANPEKVLEYKKKFFMNTPTAEHTGCLQASLRGTWQSKKNNQASWIATLPLVARNDDLTTSYEEFPRLKVGICWQCKNIHHHDKYRSISDISSFYPLLRIPDIEFYSLQKGTGEEQLKNLPEDIKITELGSTFNDFSDTAAAIENLDLVITVDTSVLHMAGSMGKKTLLLLEYSSDWKWLTKRDDSIWYESVKLLRQNEERTWDFVIDNAVDFVKK
ncbi:MAG: tetratricopeptide repeat protein [Candidatus Gastranaerophilaceae bacterium]